MLVDDRRIDYVQQSGEQHADNDGDGEESEEREAPMGQRPQESARHTSADNRGSQSDHVPPPSDI